MGNYKHSAVIARKQCICMYFRLDTPIQNLIIQVTQMPVTKYAERLYPPCMKILDSSTQSKKV